VPGGHKNFTGTTAMSADIDNFLMRQTRMRGADVAERDAELTGPTLEDGMFCITLDTYSVWSYQNSAWVPISTPPTSYTPVWSNFTPGSGTPVADYWYDNGRLRAAGKFTCAGDTTAAGGNILQTLPNSESASTKWQGGVGLLNDVSVPFIHSATIGITLGGTTFAWVLSVLGTLTNANWTPANGDILTWDLTVAV